MRWNSKFDVTNTQTQQKLGAEFLWDIRSDAWKMAPFFHIYSLSLCVCIWKRVSPRWNFSIKDLYEVTFILIAVESTSWLDLLRTTRLPFAVSVKLFSNELALIMGTRKCLNWNAHIPGSTKLNRNLLLIKMTAMNEWNRIKTGKFSSRNTEKSSSRGNENSISAREKHAKWRHF